MTEPGTPATPPERRPIEDSITPLISTLTFGGRVFAQAMSRVTVEGAIDEIPMDGPLILAANHASNLDAVVLGSWLIPKLGRRIHWLGKKELFDWPVVGWAAANGGVHPVDRGAADVDAFRLAKRILDEGHVLFVFPEGTRSPDGSLQEAQDGLAVLAIRTGSPIVPLAIAGSNRVWPRGQKLPPWWTRHRPRRAALPSCRGAPGGHGSSHGQAARHPDDHGSDRGAAAA